MNRDNYKVTDDYVIFHGSFLSNWYPCSIKYEGHDFYSSEQLFMWLKASFFNDKETANKILLCRTPKEAKLLGRQVKGFHEDKWRAQRIPCMYTAVYSKFNQNKTLKDKLIELGWNNSLNKTRCFVEGSPYDNVWGIGIDWQDVRANDSRLWKGCNFLGRVLDSVRKELSGTSLYNEF